MRFEYKYYVPLEQLDTLRNLMKPFVRVDDFAAAHGGDYTVRSIYFDSPAFEHFHSKQEHLPHRLKVRLRAYNEQNEQAPVFFEIKRKYEAPISKSRCDIDFKTTRLLFTHLETEKILNGINGADNARRFLYQVHSRNMRPVVNIIYEREPYVSKSFDPSNDLRLTIDKNLRAVPYPGIDELFLENRVRYVNSEVFILEVKFNLYCPAWIKSMLAGLHLRKEPASKYVTGILALSDQIHPYSRTELYVKGHFFNPCLDKNTKESTSSLSAHTMLSPI